MRRAIYFTAFGLMLALTLTCVPGAGADIDPFPQFDCISPNVDFWTKVYAQYSTNQGIVHDSHNLNIIYAIIDLKPYDMPGVRKTNRKRMGRATSRYEVILRYLARHPNANSPEYKRVADLFGPERKAAVFRRAARQVRCQVGQKDRFLAGLIRSGAYLEKIREIFNSYGLPQDLAYLPHVESSFNPKAYSKFGAAGIWQFTRSTGRRFMQVDYVVDERRDPIEATHAAAQLMKENYAKLGSWPLAITAYNHGASGMERAKSVHGDYPSIFQDYRSRIFKFASRNFYSEFLAARQVARDYQTYFGELTLDQPKHTLAMTLEGYVALRKLSDFFGVDMETLRALNPALRPPVFSSQKLVPKGYTLRLPADASDSQTQLLAEIPRAFYRSTQKPSRFYTVQRGDTAGKIARMHRINLSDLILANNLNRRATIYPRQTLRIPLPGESFETAQGTPVTKGKPALLVADNTPINSAESAHVEPQTRESAPDKPEPVESLAVEFEPAGSELADSAAVESESIAPAPAEPATVESVTAESVTTESGLVHSLFAEIDPKESAPSESESVESATAETEPAASELTDSVFDVPDEMESAPVEPGSVESTNIGPGPAAVELDQSLPNEFEAIGDQNAPPQYPSPVLASVIPLGARQAPQNPEAKAAPGTTDTEPNLEIVTADVQIDRVLQEKGRPVGIIHVEVEETLGHYAEWANVRTWQIRNLNGLRFGGVLHLHQKLKIPLHRTTAEKFEETRYEYHKRLQEDFFAVYRIGDVQTYRVRRGDNYWTLCHEKFDLPMWLLKLYNPQTDLADLHLRQILMIPAIEKATADEPGTGAADDDEDSTMDQEDETETNSLKNINSHLSL